MPDLDSVPAAGLGISASTLSVEISNSGWSRSTRSPTLTSHLVIVPSAIDSPICGITTSVAELSSDLRPNRSRPGSRAPAISFAAFSRYITRRQAPSPAYG
jgi:hypothetical protein